MITAVIGTLSLAYGSSEFCDCNHIIYNYFIYQLRGPALKVILPARYLWLCISYDTGNASHTILNRTHILGNIIISHTYS